MAEHRPQTFIVRILRRQRDDWQGQIVEVRSGQIYPFRSFLHLQRLLLALGEEPADDLSHATQPLVARAGGAAVPGRAPQGPAWLDTGAGRSGLPGV